MVSSFNGHDFGQTQGDSEGQGSLACCSSWVFKEPDTTQRLNDKICKKKKKPDILKILSVVKI